MITDNVRKTGTTGANYADAVSWVCAGRERKTIHLVNTGATHSLKYKLLATYSNQQTTGKEDVLVNETTLDAGQDARFQYNGQYFRLILQVKNGSGSTTYEVNYSGRG